MADDSVVLFEAAGMSASLLEPEDAATLDELLESCAEYTELTCALPPEPLTRAAAEGGGRRADAAIYIGMFEGTDLAGVIDVLIDDPVPGTWTVGFLLIEAGRRGQHLGREVFASFESWARDRGARVLRIGVAHDNDATHAFWREMGFGESTDVAHDDGARIIALERPLMLL